MASAILVQAQKESHRNLPQFTGDLSQDVDEYIKKIEGIGALTKEPEEVLHVLLKEKFSGHAERWYKDNEETLNTWSRLQLGIRERFKQPFMTQTLFATLDQRKQEPHETVSTYYDHVCRLCRRVDPDMSNKMIVHFLHKGIRDDMRTNIARALLTEKEQTPETFLKIARIEEQLDQATKQEETSKPYFPRHGLYHSTTSVVNLPTFQPHSNPRTSQLSSSITQPVFHQQQPLRPRSTYSPRQPHMHTRSAGDFQQRTTQQQQHLQRTSCLVCGRYNHRTIDCFHRKPTGCFKCGQTSHRVGACPQVFIQRDQ
jgi:hypothetical protein